LRQENDHKSQQSNAPAFNRYAETRDKGNGKSIPCARITAGFDHEEANNFGRISEFNVALALSAQRIVTPRRATRRRKPK